MKTADRLNSVKEYYFSKKLREIENLKSKGIDVINAGIGSPDLAPHPSVIAELQEQSTKEHAHKYQSYKGIAELRLAFSNWYQKYFNCNLDPDHEILPLMGSKEGIMHISLAFLNKGDKVLIPDPGYPTYAAAAKIAEANIITYDLKEKNNWLPDLKSIEKMDLSCVKIMWINYPHMPTGANVNNEDLSKIVAFGKRNNILICNDNPYGFILNATQNSLLQFKNEYKNLLELNSLSKSHNMAGWRIGMLGGNTDLIQAVLKVKSNMDSGMFYGIQKAAIKALYLSNDWYSEINKIYKNRRLLVWEIMDLFNTSYDKNATGMFIWAKLNNQNSIEFTDKILEKYAVFITPGDIFGNNGKGYIRMSLCSNENTLKEILNRIKK
jgi:aspartate/methionine/tyrosine aminotransferase